MAMALSESTRRSLRRRFGHPIEAALILVAYGLLSLLPLDWASALGGALARWIGPLLPVSKVGRRNLACAFPDWPAERIERTLVAVWENLGRTAAEYPHLGRIMRERVEIADMAPVHAARARRDSGQTQIFFSGHFANWEIMPLAAAHYGFPLTSVFRAANNPYVDQLVRYSRRANSGKLVPKGAAGLREVLDAMRSGEPVGLLVDQKLNAGIAVPLFGRPAMTGPVLAQLAYRFECPVIPARVERLEGARFRVTAGPPLVLPKSGDRAADVQAAMEQVNQLLESWIRARPEQWLWLHRRWPKEDMSRV